MAELADRLSSYLEVVRARNDHPVLLIEALRFPAGDSGTLRGAPRGTELWSTSEGSALLNLAANDPEVLAVFEGNWSPRQEARMILASAVGRWLQGGGEPEQFAQAVETELWASLRRVDVVATAVSLVERVVVPPEGLTLPYGRSVVPPLEGFMAWAFSRAWPTYSVHLPTGPYALFVARVSVPRRVFSGLVGPIWARIGVNLIADAAWLATGVPVRISHTVAWEESAFPIATPEHYPPERPSTHANETVDLGHYRAALAALVPRLAVLGGIEPNPPELEEATEATLQTLRGQVEAAVHSADPTLALLLAFAAADGSLRDADEPNGVAPRRYGFLCGRDRAERQEIARVFKCLDPVRDALAQGSRPTNEQIRRFVGDETDAPESQHETLWFPLPWDQSQRAARARALDLLRRLYRAWLLATLQLQDERVVPGMSRAEVLQLLRDAQRNVPGALEAISARIGS